MGIIKRQHNVIWLAFINLVRKNKIVSIRKNESPVNFLLKKTNKLFILWNLTNHPSFFDSESFSKHCPSPYLNSKVSWNFDRLVVFFCTKRLSNNFWIVYHSICHVSIALFSDIIVITGHLFPINAITWKVGRFNILNATLD